MSLALFDEGLRQALSGRVLLQTAASHGAGAVFGGSASGVEDAHITFLRVGIQAAVFKITRRSLDRIRWPSGKARGVHTLNRRFESYPDLLCWGTALPYFSGLV